MEPQSRLDGPSGAPGTFSMTYGLPAWISPWRVGSMRSGASFTPSQRIEVNA